MENQFPALHSDHGVSARSSRRRQAMVRATEALLAGKTTLEVDLRALTEVPASECEDAARRVADRISAEFKPRS
jgi:hypothetical protein